MDKGRYGFTRNASDMSKFRTPSLWDVLLTRPWMHNGSFTNMDSVLNRYDHGMFQPKPTRRQKKDPSFPRTDPLIKKLYLTPEEKKALIAFLDAITGIPYKMDRPQLPQ